MRILSVVREGVDKAPKNVVKCQAQLTQCFVAGRGGEVLPPLRTFFYIDALNLYYGALQNTPYRWLDIIGFCGALLKQKPHFNEKDVTKWRSRLPYLFKAEKSAFDIKRIKIFTAPLAEIPWDKGAGGRQKHYLAALEAHDTGKLIEICYGEFKVREKTARDAKHPHQKRKIISPEEKGTDVNLALHMLNDACNDEYDCAVMVSNDTDLVSALDMVRKRGKLMGVGFPLRRKRKPAGQLINASDFYVRCDVSNVNTVACQLPETVTTPQNRKLHRLPSWDKPSQSKN